jgi:hypothetical protein
MDQSEMQALIEQHLSKKEQEFYNKYLAYMVQNNFIELSYFLKHKHLFFRYMK